MVTNWTGILIFTGSAAGGGSVADDALAVVIKKASLALKADPAWLVTFLALLAAFGLGNGIASAVRLQEIATFTVAKDSRERSEGHVNAVLVEFDELLLVKNNHRAGV